jgi:anti-sigma factor RsiW
MNTDDPKFTAYILNELPPDEHTQVLEEMERDGALAAEANELHRFTESLRAELQAEVAERLTPEQRAAVLWETLPIESNVAIMKVSWWRSPWLVSSAAALVIGGFVSAIYFQARHIERLTAERTGTLDSAQNVALIQQPDASSGAGDIPESTVTLQMRSR